MTDYTDEDLRLAKEYNRRWWDANAPNVADADAALVAFRAEARREADEALAIERKLRMSAEEALAEGESENQCCDWLDGKTPTEHLECARTKVAVLKTALLKAREALQSEREACERIVEGQHRPDAELIRALPGDQTSEDRYWVGWTDALDDLLRRLRERTK